MCDKKVYKIFGQIEWIMWNGKNTENLMKSMDRKTH